MSKQEKTEQVSKSAYGMHTDYAKSDERYWQNRIFKRTRTYSVQITHKRKRFTFQLHTANKKRAGQIARDIYLSLKSAGWAPTLERFTPKKETQTKGSTVGDLLRCYADYADVPAKTSANYARIFRTIVAGIKNIDSDKSRFDYVNGGAEKWRARVDSVKLTDITPAKVQKWKLAYVKARAVDPLKEKSVKRTVNSYIRYGKSLFSSKTLIHLQRELELPDPLPFDGVDLYPRQSMRYESTFDIEKLVEDARRELPGLEADQQWLIFLLAVSAGMRRNEIDKLTWRQVDLHRMEISLKATKYFKPKSDNSGTMVAIDSDLTTMLRGYKARGAEFVIVEKVAPRLHAKVAHYRANRHFEALNRWLKAHGVDERKPLHALRKEAGSLVNKHHGLYAASRFLRHADIQVTSAHYVDTKERITSGLGALLSGKVEGIEKGVKRA